MLALDRPGLFRAKMHIWDMAIDTPNRIGSVSEAFRDPKVAREMLARTYAALESRYHEMSKPAESSLEDWGKIPEVYIGYLYGSMMRFLELKLPFEEAFGLSRRGKRKWSDQGERWAASVPYKIIMVRRDSGESEDVESAITEATEKIRNTSPSECPEYAKIALNIEVPRLWQLYSKWKDQLQELEVRVEEWAAGTIEAEKNIFQ